MTETELKQLKETRNKYYREYRAKNKDKVKEYNKNYWLKKATEGAKDNE